MEVQYGGTHNKKGSLGGPFRVRGGSHDRLFILAVKRSLERREVDT